MLGQTVQTGRASGLCDPQMCQLVNMVFLKSWIFFFFHVKKNPDIWLLLKNQRSDNLGSMAGQGYDDVE